MTKQYKLALLILLSASLTFTFVLLSITSWLTPTEHIRDVLSDLAIGTGVLDILTVWVLIKMNKGD